MNNIPAYNTEHLEKGTERIRYIFESIGEKSITKVIEYSYITSISGRKVFNLGFGDYDSQNDHFIDNVNSNNGDMRKVFSTVLDSVPKFFSENDNAAILVQGSDSAVDFKIKCKKTCTKKCGEACKNFNRRIKTYRYYVDRNFVKLSKEYVFFGSINVKEPNFVQYVPKNEYFGILVFKKK